MKRSPDPQCYVEVLLSGHSDSRNTQSGNSVDRWSASTAFAIQQSESQKPDDDVKELNTNQNPANQNPANQNPQSVPQNNTEQTDSMKNESPKTGEDDNLLVLAAWLFLLGSGFAGVTYYRKRKHLY